MGTGASLPSKFFSSKQNGSKSDKQSLTPYDSSLAGDGNIGALKVIINVDGSRIALMKFLKSTGLEPLMDYYFEVEELKKESGNDFVVKAKDLLDRYNVATATGVSAKTSSSVKVIGECIRSTKLTTVSITEDSVDETIDEFIATQTSVLGKLSGHLDEFLESNYYTDWLSFQKSNDKNRIATQEAVDLASSKGGGGVGVNHMRSIDGPAVTRGATGVGNASDLPSSKLEQIGGVSGPGAVKPPSCSDKYPAVLVVDDSNIAAKLMTFALEKSGHKVHKANNGRTALQMLSTHIYDIVLIDMNMPIMDGFEAVRLIRASQAQQESTTGTAKSKKAGTPPLTAASSALPAGSAASSSSPHSHTPTPHSAGSGGAVNPSLEIAVSASEFPHSFSGSIQVQASGLLIVGMSADNDKATLENALEAGADVFLPKPFHIEKFNELIANMEK